jgi:hypothetical protein
MYIVAIHTISNPEKFWTAAKTLAVPSHIKLHTVFPSTDGAKGMCLWQAESLGAMKQFLEPVTNGVASNEYMVVADANAVGLPR